MINSINELQAATAAIQPVMFPGLPEDEQPLTDFENLTDDQRDCYTVIVVLAFKMGQLCPYHWANKNFEKARTMRLDSWYHMGLSIKTRSWNSLLNSFEFSKLQETSLCVLLCTFHEGLPHQNWKHP